MSENINPKKSQIVKKKITKDQIDEQYILVIEALTKIYQESKLQTKAKRANWGKVKKLTLECESVKLELHTMLENYQN